jgi:hypothetical protein
MVETKDLLEELHTPTLYVLGGPTDIAYANGMDDYAKIDHVPVAVASIDKGHGGTYWEPNGGVAADVVVQWLEWQLRSNAVAARMFVGADCGLCTDTAWEYESKRLTVSVVDGTFDDGTRWALAKPANWNGIVILDLDGANFMARRGRSDVAAPATDDSATIASYFSGFNAWLLERGYAYGGIAREPVGYDYPRAVELMLEARARAAEAWGTPKRTLVLGSSRGAFAGRKALELRPDIFDGGLISAGGGAGEIAVLNNKLNAVFVLKTLVDPQAPLALVNIDPQAESQALSALVARAGSTAAGRARLALASAIVQMPRWTNARSPRPSADDYEAQLDQMQASWGFAIATPVRAAVEAMAGGNVSWNTGVDYAELLANSGRDDMVRALYDAAGLRLRDDLQTLAAASRISASPQAVARAERLMTYSGHISDPLVNVDNDDPVDPLSDKLVYRDLLRASGSDHLFQLLWSDRPGHGGMSSLDRAVGFSLLVEYLENGEWGDVSLPALRRRALEILAATDIDLGELYLYEPDDVPPAPSTWDATNWGTYAAE